MCSSSQRICRFRRKSLPKYIKYNTAQPAAATAIQMTAQSGSTRYGENLGSIHAAAAANAIAHRRSANREIHRLQSKGYVAAACTRTGTLMVDPKTHQRVTVKLA